MEDTVSPDIFISLAGHDKGRAFIVLGTEGEKLRLVDGKTRKLENPKIKSQKHICFVKEGTPELAEALRQGTATDKLIRKELAIFRGKVGD